MKRLTCVAIALGLTVPALTFAQSQDERSDAEIRNRLADLLRDAQPASEYTATTARNITPPIFQWLDHVPAEPIDWQETPFNEIIEWFADREETGAPVDMNIVPKTLVMEEAGVDTEYEVTLRLTGAEMGEILRLVLEQVGGSDPATKLGFVAQGNLLTISTQDDLNSKMYLKAYDVTDIVLRVPDFTEAPRMDVSNLQERQGQASRGGGGGGSQGNLFQTSGEEADDEESKRAGRMEALRTLIEETIARETWQANGGEGTIGFSGSSLIIYNTLEVHQRIESAFPGGVSMR